MATQIPSLEPCAYSDSYSYLNRYLSWDSDIIHAHVRGDRGRKEEPMTMLIRREHGTCTSTC